MADRVDSSGASVPLSDADVLRLYGQRHGYRWTKRALKSYGHEVHCVVCGGSATWDHNASGYCDQHYAQAIREWRDLR